MPSSSVPNNRCKRPLDDDEAPSNGHTTPMEHAVPTGAGDESKKPKLDKQQGEMTMF